MIHSHRFKHTLASRFTNPEHSTDNENVVFFKASSDEGVIRNGGRNGARLAPTSFLNRFKRLTITEKFSSWSFIEYETANCEEELTNFQNAQILHSKRLNKLIEKHPSSILCQIGGGHDHIFPFLLSIQSYYAKIIVINVDAHADTRLDIEPNSGTPFRQFDNCFPEKLELYQFGLNRFANSEETLKDLKKGPQSIVWREDFYDQNFIKNIFSKICEKVTESKAVVFSLDADALDSSIVPGVSAVNGQGIKLDSLHFLWDEYLKLNFKHRPFLGIYELNPVYDTLSATSMITMSNFLFSALSKVSL